MARARHKPQSPGLAAPSRGKATWALAIAAGLAVRIFAVQYSTEYGYFGDHDDFVRWGIQAIDEGVLTLYDHAPPRWDARSTDGRAIRQRPVDRVCNYPPLSVYVLWLNGGLLKLADPDRIINTPTSRNLFAIWGIVADFVLAFGCVALVRALRPGSPDRLVFLLAILAPPVVYDSAVWQQTESWVLAPAVWMLWAMVRRRWWLAGALWGVMFALKPHAVLFGPLWLIAMVICRQFWKPLGGMVVAGAVLQIIALPFTLHSGLAWWRLSYVENLFKTYTEFTTLMAFNVWYVDQLLTENRDATVTVLGLSKNLWGRILLGSALVLLAILIITRWRGRPRGLVYWTTLSLLAFVMLPTQVHERYVVLAIPFGIAAAMLRPRAWIGLVPLLAAATAQLMWPHWVKTRPGNWELIKERQRKVYDAMIASTPPESRAEVVSFGKFIEDARRKYFDGRRRTSVYEWSVALASLGGSLLMAIFLLTDRPPPPEKAARRGRRPPRR